MITSEILRGWYRDDEMNGDHIWELVTVSDIVCIIFVLENHGKVWNQDWKFHEDILHTSNVEKDKFREYMK